MGWPRSTDDVADAHPAGEALETFLALMPDAAVVVDGSGRIVSLNEHAAELFGHEPEALVGQDVEVLVPERFRHAHRAHRLGYAAAPRARAMGAGQDLVGRRRDGSEFAVDISLAPIGVGDRPLVVAAVRDASVRRALGAAHAELAAIVQSSADGILAMTASGTITSWNASAERLLGYRADEVVGTHVSRLVPPAASATFERQLDAALRGSPLPAQDTVWRSASGEQLDVSIAVSPLRDAGEVVMGFAVLVRDIAERKQAELELRHLLGRVSRQERWHAATSEIRLAILAGPSRRSTLELICEKACALLGARAAAVVDEADEVQAGAGEAAGAHGLVLRPAPEVMERARTDGTLQRADGGVGLGPASTLEASAVVVAPISAGTGPQGLLLVWGAGGPDGPGSPADLHDAADVGTPPLDGTDDVEDVAMSLAGQAALAQELGQARADRDRLLIAEDRERIARDLHDVVIQRIFAAGMSLQSIEPVLGEGRARERVGKVVDNLDEIIREIRTAIFALGSPDGGDLRADVLAVAREAAEQLGFVPSVRFDGAVESTIPLDVTGHVLAVAREALSNVARHARASRADVVLSASPADGAALVVTDDGVGLGGTGRQSGLANLRRRAEALGGTLDVSDAPGGGTRLEWRVPLA